MKHLLVFGLLLVLSFQIQAQLSREDAINIIFSEVLSPDSLDQKHLYSKYEMMFEGDTLWQEGNFGYQINPYPENWVFFIDDLPIAYWAHPCRYIYVNVSNGQFQVFDDNWPPENYFSFEFTDLWEWILETGTTNNASPSCAVRIFPNPCCNVLYFRINKAENSISRIVFKDLAGRTVINCYAKTSSIVKMDVGSLKAGVYLLNILYNDTLIRQEKVIVSGNR